MVQLSPGKKMPHSTQESKQRHQQEVLGFLRAHFPSHQWRLTQPKSSGSESYLAHSQEVIYFVKVGVQIDRYQAAAAIGLTPQIAEVGYLEDRTSIMIQRFVTGRRPSSSDFRLYLEKIARTVNRMHHSPELRSLLPEMPTGLYREVGLMRLYQVQHRWADYEKQVPDAADLVNEGIESISREIQQFSGAGLVAAHNDICNANWLISADEQIYLIDFETMSMDDPASDIGAILWWYYPPELRRKFLEITGCADDQAFQLRMRVRMALHCLNILLPREQSFDQFDPTSFVQGLIDFKAALVGEENPQGYS